jgi:hypothetical protein
MFSLASAADAIELKAAPAPGLAPLHGVQISRQTLQGLAGGTQVGFVSVVYGERSGSYWKRAMRPIPYWREFQAKRRREKKVVISFGKSLSLGTGVDISVARV